MYKNIPDVSGGISKKIILAALFFMVILAAALITVTLIALLSWSELSSLIRIIVFIDTFVLVLLILFAVISAKYLRAPAKPQQAIMDAVPVAIALFNEKMEVLYKNRAMAEFLLMHDLVDCETGFLEKLIGSGGLTDQDLDSRAEAIFDITVPNPEPFLTDIAILGHDGGSNFSLTLQRTGSEGGENSITAILLLNDVTMLTRAKIDAEAASRTKSDFLSRMSHEIRTPMNAVIGMTQIARSSSSEPEKILSCLEQVESYSHHLLGVINDILDYSKMESGKMLLDITSFSLRKNLDYAISLMEPRARERKIHINPETDDIINDIIFTDSLRLNQVLINLLSNAIKFSHEGGEVTIRVRELGNNEDFSTYRFEVIDHGIGINEFKASKLFKPFEQADGSITRNYGGTGLGLAISKTLVDMMGGKIDLESKEGEGSNFSFTIHCASAKADEVPETVKGIKDSKTYNFEGKKCLVVDDIEINREIICELLSPTNMILETAENGREAADLYRSKGFAYFDIILMDMQMPVMDGCSATEEMRLIEKEWERSETNFKPVPIIAMTANVLYEDIKKAIDSGMDAHLGKPIELDITLKTIHEQLTKP